MIIQLRGTSGSGKSYLVAQVMQILGGRAAFVPEMMGTRKQPVGYLQTVRKLYIPGHYEKPCGGCDTLKGGPIHGTDAIYSFIRAKHDEGCDVLFEGLLISVDVRRTVPLAQATGCMHNLILNTPLDACLAAINGRRQARNPLLPPVNPDNTTRKHREVMRVASRLRAAGVQNVFVGDREEVRQRLFELLGL